MPAPHQFPVPAALILGIDAYLIAGGIYVMHASDWPPFWPPMDVATQFIEVLAHNEMMAVGLAMLSGILLIGLTAATTVWSLLRLLRWQQAGRAAGGHR